VERIEEQRRNCRRTEKERSLALGGPDERMGKSGSRGVKGGKKEEGKNTSVFCMVR